MDMEAKAGLLSIPPTHRNTNEAWVEISFHSIQPHHRSVIGTDEGLVCVSVSSCLCETGGVEPKQQLSIYVSLACTPAAHSV